MDQLRITSPAFAYEGNVPKRHTCDGDGISPELHIEDLPQDTVTLALISEDPDAPRGTFDHWIVWNIERTTRIGEGENPGVSGGNSAGRTGYHPPCPPSGTHRYYFHIYALDGHLGLSPGASRQELEAAMEGRILAKGTLMGQYGREA